MSKRTVKCTSKHTPLSPSKNRIRRDMLKKTTRQKDIITISHALLDVLMIREHKGRIFCCDIDPAVREAIRYLRNDYVELKVQKAGMTILETVSEYCKKCEDPSFDDYNIKNLGVVDIDLAFTVKGCAGILLDVLNVLKEAGYTGRTFLTFVNGRRDEFSTIEGKSENIQKVKNLIAKLRDLGLNESAIANSVMKQFPLSGRIAYLKALLPDDVELVGYVPYYSMHHTKNAQRIRGSSMCVVEFKHSKKLKRGSDGRFEKAA